MSKTLIEVETAVNGCGRNCPELDIDMNGVILKGKGEDDPYWHYNQPVCKNMERCRRLLATLEKNSEKNQK